MFLKIWYFWSLWAFEKTKRHAGFLKKPHNASGALDKNNFSRFAILCEYFAQNMQLHIHFRQLIYTWTSKLGPFLYVSLHTLSTSFAVPILVSKSMHCIHNIYFIIKFSIRSFLLNYFLYMNFRFKRQFFSPHPLRFSKL